jgi:serine phosphatase RsbU (regulator of sigma subunit)
MMKVGGDFVDVCYVLDEQGLGLFVCDVSGHGIAAAFISSMVKMALANWRDYLAMPHQMLNQLYYALVEKLGANFVTASICYVDLKSGMARFSGAGHPPALIVRSGGEIEYIKPRGKIINGIMSPYFGVEEKSLGNKDKIVFYTDGITECINERGEMFGDEAFISLVKTYRNFSPHDMCENIMEHMKEYIGTASFNDDITLLIMEFHEENI